MDQTDQTLKGGGADSLLGDSSNISNGSNTPDGDNQGDLIGQPNLDLPTGWYESDCLRTSNGSTLNNWGLSSVKYILAINTTSSQQPLIQLRFPHYISLLALSYKKPGCNDGPGRYSGTRHQTTSYLNVNKNVGNNTSYFIISDPYGTANDSTSALAFHIDNDGALYINHLADFFLFDEENERRPAINTTNFTLENEGVFSDFINDPTIGVRYYPSPTVGFSSHY